MNIHLCCPVALSICYLGFSSGGFNRGDHLWAFNFPVATIFCRGGNRNRLAFVIKIRRDIGELDLFKGSAPLWVGQGQGVVFGIVGCQLLRHIDFNLDRANAKLASRGGLRVFTAFNNNVLIIRNDKVPVVTLCQYTLDTIVINSLTHKVFKKTVWTQQDGSAGLRSRFFLSSPVRRLIFFRAGSACLSHRRRDELLKKPLSFRCSTQVHIKLEIIGNFTGALLFFSDLSQTLFWSNACSPAAGQIVLQFFDSSLSALLSVCNFLV